MRSRYLVGALALALAVTAAGTALGAGETQKIKGQVCTTTCVEPVQLPANTPKAVAMKITLTGDTATPGGEPADARSAVVNFDDSIVIDTQGLKRVAPSVLSNRTTTDVRGDATLAGAKIGLGTADLCFGLAGPGTPCVATIQAEVTVFNATPSSTGKPRIALHVSEDSLGPIGQPDPNPMVGIISRTAGDLANKLAIGQVGQPAAGGLTKFFVNLRKHWTYQGRGHDLVRARCNDASKRLNYRATVTFPDHSASGNDTSSCKL